MKTIHFRTIQATVGLLLSLLCLSPVSGQQVETYQFAQRDTCALHLDGISLPPGLAKISV
ncbi:MAG: hypothetical protein RR471_09640 [Bacteroides sp.]